MERRTSDSKTRHLSVVAQNGNASDRRLTRAEVADRLGASVSTVRRYEGDKLHPKADEAGVHWFDPAEVSALAAERANEQRPRRNTKSANARTSVRTAGEVAALAFERFEQRQSLAEVVIGLQLEPAMVRALFSEWTVGLVEGQLQMSREPSVARDIEIPRVSAQVLATRLSELPAGQVTRISVGRYRGPFLHSNHDYAEVMELGGFLVSGPCETAQITKRFGDGDYRVSAYGFEPAGLRWEVVVENLGGRTASSGAARELEHRRHDHEAR
jgi:hypothetical protein